MTTVTHTQTKSELDAAHHDASTTTYDFRAMVQTVGTGMRDIVQSSSEILAEFQDALKPILPLLSEEQYNQMNDTFIEYHQFLTTSQRFLTRALILAVRARTGQELVGSINLRHIQDMCTSVDTLMEKFLRLNPIVEAKLKDQRVIKRWRNVLGLLTIIGVCALGMGAVIGRFTTVGFTKAMKAFLIATASITVAAAAPAVVAHVAQQEMELTRVKLILKDMRGVLTTLSQNYPKIEEMAEILSDDDGTRREFVQLLKESQAEVDKGFELLRQL